LTAALKLLGIFLLVFMPAYNYNSYLWIK
jgi:hypothetical protein